MTEYTLKKLPTTKTSTLKAKSIATRRKIV